MVISFLLPSSLSAVPIDPRELALAGLRNGSSAALISRGKASHSSQMDLVFASPASVPCTAWSFLGPAFTAPSWRAWCHHIKKALNEKELWHSLAFFSVCNQSSNETLFCNNTQLIFICIFHLLWASSSFKKSWIYSLYSNLHSNKIGASPLLPLGQITTKLCCTHRATGMKILNTWQMFSVVASLILSPPTGDSISNCPCD